MFIEIRGAKKQYGTGEAAVYALDGVDFSLEKGKICVILGPSGSGKSTLLNMIGGLDSLDSGEITVDGQKITGLSKKALTAYRKQNVGFIFQFYNLIPDLTVEENVQVVSEIAADPLDMDEILTALDIVRAVYIYALFAFVLKHARLAVRHMLPERHIRIGAFDAFSHKATLLFCFAAGLPSASDKTIPQGRILFHLFLHAGVASVKIL